MASKAEEVLFALAELLECTGAKIERNAVLPERVPHSGLIIIRDGDPGEPDQSLGGYGGHYYNHAVEIEVYIERGYDNARDQDFDSLLQSIGDALESNPTLSGLLFGMAYARPSTSTEHIAGAASLKIATLQINAEYLTDTPIG